MNDLLYAFGVNIVIGIISGTLVLWFTERWKSRSDLRWQMIRLRNVLYDAEWNLDPQFHHQLSYPGERIARPSVEATEWSAWKNQCVEIRYALSEIAERMSLEGGVRESCILRPRESALAHFKKIGSVFAEQYPTKYLGVIECTTDAQNLLSEARKKAEQLTRHAVEYLEHVIHPKEGESMMNTDYYERELEEVRQKIKLHRKHVEQLIPARLIPSSD